MRRFSLLAVPALLAAFVTPSHAATTPIYDWALTVITAGPQGATDITVEVRHAGRLAAHGAPVLAGGFADATRHFSIVDVVPCPERAEQLRTTKALGGRQFTFHANRK